MKTLLFLAGYYIFLLAGTLGLNIYVTGKFALEYEPFVFLFMVLTVLTVFFIPLLAIYKITSEKHGVALVRLLSAVKGSTGIAAGIFRFPLGLTLALCLLPGFSAFTIGRIFGGVPAAGILRASVMLAIIGICFLCIGFYCSVHCRNAYSAAGYAFLIVTLVCLEPIWFGPVINAIPDADYLIQSSLLINPFAGMASALDFDIFRTSPLYQICPIGQRKFQYPFYGSVALFYIAVSLVLFWRSAAKIRSAAEPCD